MKSVLVAVAISLIASGSAFASAKPASSRQQANVRESKAMVIETDSNDVYVGRRLIGRDPDPAIRARLRSDHYLFNAP